MQWKSAADLPDCPRRPAPQPHRASVLLRLLALLALLLALGLGVWAGCSSRKTDPVPTDAGPVEKPKLRIGWPKDVEPALVRDFASGWAAKQGMLLDIVPYDPQAAPRTVPDVDLWVLAPAELPYWAAAGRLRPLPESLVKGPSFLDRLYLEVYRQLLWWNKQKYALPLLGEGVLCFHREDLFQAHGEAFHKQFGRPLKPPQTWDEVEDVARFFYELHARTGTPSASLPPLPAGDLDLEREFYTVAASFVRRGVAEDDKTSLSAEGRFSFHFSVETGENWIDTAGFVQALQVLQRLQIYRPPQPAAEAPAWFRDGKAVLCVAPVTPWAARFQERESLVRDRFGVGRVPGNRFVFDPKSGERQSAGHVNQVPYLGAGGWLGVVPRSAARPDAAFSLLAWLNDPQVSRNVATNPSYGGPFRKEHVRTESTSWEGLGLKARTAEFVQALSQTLENSQVVNPVVRLRVPDERRFRQALAARLRAAIVEKQDAEKVLKEVAARWRQLIQEKGQAEHRADYRRSLGLDP